MFRELPPKSAEHPRALTQEMIAEANHASRTTRRMGAVLGALCFGVATVMGFALSASNLGHATALMFSGTVVGLGVLCVAWGRAKSWRLLDLFRTGDEARGEVVSVELDDMQSPNGRRPWRLRYRYEVAGARHSGSMSYWTDQPPAGLEPGCEIVVLYAAGDAANSLLWAAATPRLPDVAETHTRARIDGAAWRDDPYAIGEAQVDAD